MYSDADIETAQLTHTGNTIGRLRRRGICLHGWICAPAKGPATCNDCGKVWLSADVLFEERHDLEIEYL